MKNIFQFNYDEFSRAYDLENRFSLRLGTILSIFVWIMVDVAAYYLLPQISVNIIKSSIYFLFPLLFLFLILLYIKKISRFYNFIGALVNTTTAFYLLYISYFYYYHQAFVSTTMLLMSLYAFYIFRLRFKTAITVSIIYQSVFQLLLFTVKIPKIDFYFSSVLIWSTIIFFSISSYYINIMRRKLYESSQIIEERNNVIESDLTTGRKIIDKILPNDIIVSPRCSVYTLYKPMEKVGGDFFDYRRHELKETFFVADVSGHGLASSFIALMAKKALDSIDITLSVSERMSLLNNAVTDSTVDSNFITAFLCEIDFSENVLSFSSAGHHPAFHIQAKTNKIKEFNTKGRAMGWFSNTEFNEKFIEIESGDRIIIYTDGITEAMNSKGEMLGEDRLCSLLMDNAHVRGSDLTEVILHNLVDFTGSDTFNDDITCMIIDIN